MNILVTTSRSFMLVDIRNGCYEKIDQQQGMYYGISYSDDLIFVAARNSPVGDEDTRDKEKGKIIIYDFQKHKLKEIQPPFPLRDIHQIQFYDKRLYIVCSYENKIVVLDNERWFNFFPDPEVKKDYNHFNSIFFDDNYLYLSAHNLDRPSEIWQYKKPSTTNFLVAQLKRKNLISLKKIKMMLLGKQIHNIWIHDKEIFTCSSAEKSVISSLGFRYQTGGFPRGLAVTDSYILIGISELSERKERMFTTSYILVLDRNWQLVKKITMPQEGMILEIRVPGYQDHCSPYYLGSKMHLEESLPKQKIPFL